MAQNFNAYNNVSTRAISSWLHEIPSEAGGGSQATLIAPSTYQDESQSPPESPLQPRRQKDPPRPVRQNQQTPHRLDQKPKPAQDPTQNLTALTLHSPSRRPLPLRSSLNPNPNPGPGPGPDPHVTLRETITSNFRVHCTLCAPPSGPFPTQQEREKERKPCPRCLLAKEYTYKHHHSHHFLQSYLQPISQVLGFDEAVAYLNQAIVERLAGSGGRGGDGRTYPTLGDFEKVRGVAGLRREVWERFERDGGGLLRMDRFGMVRDDLRG
ncbi:hypothetical protein MFIFM68171_03703 [Madurella fahalii]|uniref:Uncharacterized protein n=1 Tax=Madurella fahalii TaxID=1157608 RepID=A0ABQ0G6U0_9PEZI